MTIITSTGSIVHFDQGGVARPSNAPLHIATYNIHKGFSQFNRRMMVHELRARLHDLNPDILFLQEVQGQHRGHARRHADWPAQPQHQFLAESQGWGSAYGENMVYDHGHHGNAILSRFPILHSHNQDVTHLKFERRGLLHCQIALTAEHTVHCVCVHLSLFSRSRRRQMDALADYIDHLEGPMIVAGDFNDWRNHLGQQLAQRLHLQEVFSHQDGRPVRSFPAALPMFRLDRIYTRGFTVSHREVHAGAPWSALSDHAALSAHLMLA